MGTVYSTNQNGATVNELIQQSYNTVQINNEFLAFSKCTNITEDIYIKIDNSTTGNINFNQQCSTMVQLLNANNIEYINGLQTLNSNYTNYSVNTELYENGVYVGTVPIKTEYSKNLSSYAYNYSSQYLFNSTVISLSSQCNVSSLNIQTDVFLVIKNSTTGDINFIQEGNVNLSCISANSGKYPAINSLSYNSQILENDISTTKNYIIIFSIIFIVLLVVIIIVVAIIIIKKNKNENENDDKKEKPKIITYQNDNDII